MEDKDELKNLVEEDFGLFLEDDIKAEEMHIGLNFLEEDEDEDGDIITSSDDAWGDLPDNYLKIEGLTLVDQLAGVWDDLTKESEFDILPAYAEKEGKLQFVRNIEITAESILRMRRFGLTVTIERKGKPPIDFMEEQHLLRISRTIREEDKIDYSIIPDIDGDNEQG